MLRRPAAVPLVLVSLALACTDSTGGGGTGSTSSSSSSGATSVGSGGSGSSAAGSGLSGPSSSASVVSSSVPASGASSGAVVVSSSAGGGSSGGASSGTVVTSSSSSLSPSSASMSGPGSSSAGGGSSSAMDGPVSPFDYLAGIEAARCAFAARCAAVRGTSVSSLERCLARVADEERTRRLIFGQSNRAALESIYRPVERAVLQACAAAYASLPCNAEITPRECPDVVPQQTAAVGEACGDAAEGLLCGSEPVAFCQSPGLPACSVCVASNVVPPTPVTCAMDSDCTTSMHCEQGVCLPRARRKALGEVCTPSVGCVGELRCVFSAGMFTCRSLGMVGESCGSNTPCAVDLQCVSGTCAERQADGMPCSRSGGSACLHECVFATPDAATGVCGSPTAPAAPGQACINGSYCGGGLPEYQLTGSAISGCVCRALRTNGQMCDGNHQCATGLCLSTGVCGDAIGEGGLCRTNEDCGLGACIFRDGESAPHCRTAACAAPAPTCDPLPSNTSAATAQVLTLGAAVAGTTCGEGVYFRVPGPIDQFATFRVEFTLDDQAPRSGMALQAYDASNQGALQPIANGSTQGGNDGVARLTFISNGAEQLVLQATPTNGDAPARFHLLVTSVPSGGGACSTVPTNTSLALATVLTQDAPPVPAEYCSLSERTNFYWKVNGPFSIGDTVTFNTTGVASLGMAVVAEVAGMEERLMDCVVAPAFPACSVTLSEGYDALWLRTTDNPSVDSRELFELSVSVVP